MRYRPAIRSNPLLFPAAAPAKHCSRLVSAMANSGITQNCTVHDNCMGACCTTELLAHKIVYNFTVLPCAKPSVHLDFSITDIKGLLKS